MGTIQRASDRPEFAADLPPGAGRVNNLPENMEMLKTLAAEARDRAYAVYSNFPVGCSIALKDGSVVTGSSVENAAYSVTLCAERSAIAQIISTRGESSREIASVVVLGPAGRNCSPCGACRQWLVEHAPGAEVYFPWMDGYMACKVEELMPFGFALADADAASSPRDASPRD